MIEILCAIIGSSAFTLWLDKAFCKFNRLKTEHKHRAKCFAAVVMDKDTSPDVKNGIMANENTRKLVIEGQTVDDEVVQFTNTWKQFLKCLGKPF